MNVIDIVFGVILLFGLVRGLMNGFFAELASLTALIAGLYAAINFSYLLQDFLAGFVTWQERYIQIIAFTCTFIIVVVLILFLGKLLTKLFDLIAFGLVNRLLGSIFGGLKMAFFLSLIVLIFNAFNKNGNLIEEKTIETSVLYGPVEGLVPMLLPIVLNEDNWIEEKERHPGF